MTDPAPTADVAAQSDPAPAAAPAAAEPRPALAILAELRRLAPHIDDAAAQRRALVLLVKLVLAVEE